MCISTIDTKRLEHHILAFPMGQKSRARTREGREKEEEETKRIPPPFIRRVFFVSFSFKRALYYDGLSALYDDDYDSRTKDEEGEKRGKKSRGRGQGFGCFSFSFFLSLSHPPLVLSVNNRHARPARMREMDAQ